MAQSKALPPLDLRDGHTVSTIVVAINGMMPGNYGNMHTGTGNGDYVHVTRHDNGMWSAVWAAVPERITSNNALRVAQFIADRITL